MPLRASYKAKVCNVATTTIRGTASTLYALSFFVEANLFMPQHMPKHSSINATRLSFHLSRWLVAIAVSCKHVHICTYLSATYSDMRVCHFSTVILLLPQTNASFAQHAARHNLYFAIFHFCCCCCCNCHHYSAACCYWPQYIRACYFLLFAMPTCRHADDDLSLSWGCSHCIACTSALLHRHCLQHYASLTLTQCHNLHLPILQLIFVHLAFISLQLVFSFSIAIFIIFLPCPLLTPCECVRTFNIILEFSFLLL